LRSRRVALWLTVNLRLKLSYLLPYSTTAKAPFLFPFLPFYQPFIFLRSQVLVPALSLISLVGREIVSAYDSSALQSPNQNRFTTYRGDVGYTV